MVTAGGLGELRDGAWGSARGFVTVGLGHPVAAAGMRDLLPWARPDTINIFVVTEAPLTDAALAGALQTAVEAKVQALTEAGVTARNMAGFATGTASQPIAIALAPGRSRALPGTPTKGGHKTARACWPAAPKRSDS